jgi:hypothetical protein
MLTDIGTGKNVKEVLIFKPHSFIDVITNSSSELFVCKTKQSLESVKELLQEMINLHNRLYGDNFSFDDSFGSIYRLNTESDVKKHLKDMVWWDNDYPDIPYPENMDNNDEAWKEYNSKVDSAADKIIKENMKKEMQEYLGCIIIESRTDNSIPYGIFDLIENEFNARRRHLG